MGSINYSSARKIYATLSDQAVPTRSAARAWNAHGSKAYQLVKQQVGLECEYELSKDRTHIA